MFFFKSRSQHRLSSGAAGTTNKHIVFVGNPGVGKSTLVNSLAGKIINEAGNNLGQGKNVLNETIVVDDFSISDTPGLDDPVLREEAAKSITRVLRGGGQLVLAFVFAPHAGRIQASHFATLVTVLDAIEKEGICVKDNFCVICNKIQQATKMTQEETNTFYRKFIAERLQQSDNTGKYTTDQILILKEQKELLNKDNVLLNDITILQTFLGASRTLQLPIDNQAYISKEDYNTLTRKQELLYTEYQKSQEERKRLEILSKETQKRAEEFEKELLELRKLSEFNIQNNNKYKQEIEELQHALKAARNGQVVPPITSKTKKFLEYVPGIDLLLKLFTFMSS